MFWGRPPGEIPQYPEQEIPAQEQNLAPAMLPGVPAGVFHQNNMIDYVNAVQEDHEEVDLDQLQPLQDMMNGEDENMPQIDSNIHPINNHQIKKTSNRS